jgi:hypothetical protein
MVLKFFDVCRAVGGQHQRRAIGPEYRGGIRRVAEFETMPRQIGSERGMGRRCEEEHKGCGHHIVMKPRQGDFLGAQAPAEAITAFENQNTLSL